MRWSAAPAWVQAADLSAWVAHHAAGWPAPLGVLAVEAGLAVREDIALALTFPVRRALHLQAADESLVRLAERLRLAERAGLLPPSSLAHADGQIRAIGRMLGGWQRARRSKEGVDPAAGGA